MAKRKIDEDCLSCSLCLEILNEPKTLPCLHRFCETCLHKHITCSTVQWTGNFPSFLCPYCRENIKAPDPKRLQSEWASLFKTDFLIKDIIGGSREQPEMKNACPTHTDIEYDCYCFDCSAILCHKCVIHSHRQCGRVEMLTDAACDRKAAVNDAIKNVRTLIEESTKWESHCKVQKYALECESNKVSTEIQARGKLLRQHIEQEETKLLAQLAEKCNRRADKVNSAVVEIQSMKKQFQGRLDTAASKLSLPNFELMADTFVLDVIKECQQDPSKAVEDMKQICNKIPNLTFSFQQTTFPAVLGSIVESRNDNSIVTSVALSQVSDRNREKSTSSGILPPRTFGETFQIIDRNREKSTSSGILPPRTFSETFQINDRNREKPSSSGILPPWNVGATFQISDRNREKSTSSGILPPWTVGATFHINDRNGEKSTSSGILPPRTFGETFQINDRNREKSTSSGILPPWTLGATFHINDRNREKSTSSGILPPRTFGETFQINDRNREKSTSSGILPPRTFGDTFQINDRNREKSTSSGILPPWNVGATFQIIDRNREKSASSGILPTMTHSIDSHIIID